ncbi:death domain-containing protein 1 [Aulostomus maculatus]
MDDRESREDRLLDMLRGAIRGLDAVRRGRDHRDAGASERREEPGSDGGGGGGRDDEEREEGEWEQKALGVLRETSVSYSARVSAWREALAECACMLLKTPPGGDHQQHPSATDQSQSSGFVDTFLSVKEDIENIMGKLNVVVTKLDAEILQLSAEENLALQKTSGDPETSVQEEGDVTSHLNSRDPPEPAHEEDGEDGHSRSHVTDSDSDCLVCADGAETVQGQEIEGQGNDKGCVSPEQFAVLEERKKDRRDDWITVGLAGQLQENLSDVPDACFIRAPAGVAEVLRCELADGLSCLMVTGSEELVSRVIRVKVQDSASIHFPVTVVVPYCARYRGNYRNIAVKIVDGERKANYISPVTTEGAYGGQRGTFAEAKVYSLGLFAVVSCLKRENYTVPRRGVSHKLPMDTRICLNYLPGSFTAPVMAQSMIQPLDAVLLATIKSKSDAYHWVVSTSPMLYLTHPLSQPLRRPLTITLPCPPNPDKRRDARGHGEEIERHQTRPPASAFPAWDQSTYQRMGVSVRLLGSSVQPSKEKSSELLIVLGSRDKEWSVLEKVLIRNQQNGLVSFELMENFDRLLVFRLLSPLQPCYLTSLAEELEESVCRHAVTIVLRRKRNEPHAVLVAALPSRDLSWELSKLQAQGYDGPAETSPEFSVREGDQLLLRLFGNITSVGTQNNQHDILQERITFHSQRKNHLLVQLTEVDPFGNYSSPHYKGTAVFYKVARDEVEWRGDAAVLTDSKHLGDPVCKLSLTLPKKVRTIKRPIMARVKLCEETDSLSDSLLLWLAGELLEEEVALLALSLRLRRSSTQLVKLRAGDSPSAQAFHILAMWRRELPASQHQPKASQLAHCLAKIGRPDLARELLLRQAATSRPDLVICQ